MSTNNAVSDKKKALLAHKEKLLSDIKYYEKRIKDFNDDNSTKYYEENYSSDSEDDFPTHIDIVRSVGQLKQQQAMLATCIQATEELTRLQVLQSAVNIVAQPVLDGERPVTEEGSWCEVTAECRIDMVPFSIMFYVHKPNRTFGPPSYRSLKVLASKTSHEAELAHSVLATVSNVSLAVEVFRSYAVAYRSRRSTLAKLADKYAKTLFMEPLPEGGYLLKYANLLEMSWRLENKTSPVAPFHHKMKFDLEYMDESHLKIITQAHKALSNPTITTDERTLILAQIINTCLQAKGPDNNDSLESDLESVKTQEKRQLPIENDLAVKKRKEINKNVEENGEKSTKMIEKRQNTVENDMRKKKEGTDEEMMAPPKSLPKKTKPKGKENQVDNRKSVKRTLTDEGSSNKKAKIDDNTKNNENSGKNDNDLGKNDKNSENVEKNSAKNDKNPTKNNKDSANKNNIASNDRTSATNKKVVNSDKQLPKSGKKLAKNYEANENKDAAIDKNKKLSITQMVLDKEAKSSDLKSKNKELKENLPQNKKAQEKPTTSNGQDNIKKKTTDNIDIAIEKNPKINAKQKDAITKDPKKVVDTGKAKKDGVVSSKNDLPENSNKPEKNPTGKIPKIDAKQKDAITKDPKKVGNTDKAKKDGVACSKNDLAKNSDDPGKVSSEKNPKINAKQKVAITKEDNTGKAKKDSVASSKNDLAKNSVDPANVASEKNPKIDAKQKVAITKEDKTGKAKKDSVASSKNDLPENSTKPGNIASDKNLKIDAKQKVAVTKEDKTEKAKKDGVASSKNDLPKNTNEPANFANADPKIKETAKNLANKEKVSKNNVITKPSTKNDQIKSKNIDKGEEIKNKSKPIPTEKNTNDNKIKIKESNKNANSNINKENQIQTTKDIEKNIQTKKTSDPKKVPKNGDTQKTDPKTKRINEIFTQSPKRSPRLIKNTTFSIEKVTVQNVATKNKAHIANIVSTDKIIKNLSHKNPSALSKLKTSDKFISGNFKKNGNTTKENSKIPQKLNAISESAVKKNPMRISPRKMMFNFKSTSDSNIKKIQKPITNIPRLMKKPVPKAK